MLVRDIDVENRPEQDEFAEQIDETLEAGLTRFREVLARLSWALLLCVAVTSFAKSVWSQSTLDRPWELPGVPILIDPYEGNAIDWNELQTDPHVAAVVHKASEGLKADSMFISRSDEARKRNLYFGAYHLGRPGDPIAQAKFFIELASKARATFLAIDIEEDDPSRFMSIAEAKTFITYVYEHTGRYPAVYVNFSVFTKISEQYDSSSVFAKTPLWLSRPQPRLGDLSKRVWSDYTLWQFSTEENCSPNKECLYRVPGTEQDMDIDVLNGNAKALVKLFE